MDYAKINNLEPAGLRQYVHKFDLGYQDYYYASRYFKELCKLNDPQFQMEEPGEYYKSERIVRDGWHQLKQEMLAKQFRFMLRVTLQIKDNGIGEVEYNSNGERA